jgi:hypothetical protein
MPRFALQAELYGLTQNQRNQGATAINSAFDSGKVVGDVVVDPNKTSRHGALLFVESNFDSRAEGDRIFAVCRDWASTRSTDAADGFHSYVRLREVQEAQGQVLQRLAQSPGWVQADTTEPLSR